MTRLISRAIVLGALLVAVALPPVASAATPAECQASIDAFRAATADATYFGKQADKEEADSFAPSPGPRRPWPRASSRIRSRS